jgi:hypothetical protein
MSHLIIWIIVGAIYLIRAIIQGIVNASKPKPGVGRPPQRPVSTPGFGAPPPANPRAAAPPYPYGAPQQAAPYGYPPPQAPAQQQPYPVAQLPFPQQAQPAPRPAQPARQQPPPPPAPSPAEQTEASIVDQAYALAPATAPVKSLNDLLKSQPPIIGAVIMQEVLAPPIARRR